MRLKPVFPPNRILREGELPCEICSSGIEAHRNGALGHPFPPAPWTDPGRNIRDGGWPSESAEDVLNRGFVGRFAWLLLGI